MINFPQNLDAIPDDFWKVFEEENIPKNLASYRRKQLKDTFDLGALSTLLILKRAYNNGFLIQKLEELIRRDEYRIH